MYCIAQLSGQPLQLLPLFHGPALAVCQGADQEINRPAAALHIPAYHAVHIPEAGRRTVKRAPVLFILLQAMLDVFHRAGSVADMAAHIPELFHHPLRGSHAQLLRQHPGCIFIFRHGIAITILGDIAVDFHGLPLLEGIQAAGCLHQTENFVIFPALFQPLDEPCQGVAVHFLIGSCRQQRPFLTGKLGQELAAVHLTGRLQLFRFSDFVCLLFRFFYQLPELPDVHIHFFPAAPAIHALPDRNKVLLRHSCVQKELPESV